MIESRFGMLDAALFRFPLRSPACDKPERHNLNNALCRNAPLGAPSPEVANGFFLLPTGSSTGNTYLKQTAEGELPLADDGIMAALHQYPGPRRHIAVRLGA